MPNEIDAAIAGLRELDRLGDECPSGEWAVHNYQSGTVSLNTGGRLFATVYPNGIAPAGPMAESGPGRGDWKQQNGEVAQRMRFRLGAFCASSGNNRAHLKALLDFAERAKAALEKIKDGKDFYSHGVARQALNPEAK
jgi:hypothetical protein